MKYCDAFAHDNIAYDGRGDCPLCEALDLIEELQEELSTK